MSQHVEPALTSAEWAAAYAPEGDASLGFEAVQSELVEAADHGRWHKAVALANAALPPEDPRRITARDVQLIEMAGEVLGDYARAVEPASEAREEIRASIHDLAVVGTKLAALLPPAD
jgi:hypothetical protein